jgi:hypothetical protein
LDNHLPPLDLLGYQTLLLFAFVTVTIEVDEVLEAAKVETNSEIEPSFGLYNAILVPEKR